ncbi:PREDICTED: uncharacterized protein LOC109221868 [Nicotiana attenuata]|uniref:uncharacterized protein LOC109221868 n=1 Tax=Nicotiana attenuata TaxID=49451 RepID=UPI0009053F0E|nr:PREDICTED: uncharacterized protein LOC109221868 [Nicotiana attenuata]
MGEGVRSWLAQYLAISGTDPEWLTAGVEKKPYDVKAKPVAPFSWNSLRGPDNPKDKNYKPPASAPTSQSEEPVVVEASIEPTSTVATMPPGPSTSADLPPGPFTSAGPEIPSSQAHPITVHRLSQTLKSLNNWMYTTSSELSTLTSTIATQSAPQPVQVPQSIEDALKNILDNQEKILSTRTDLVKAVASHGKAQKELAKEHKKLHKTRASRESDPAPAAVPVAALDTEQPQDVPDPQSVQVQSQVPAAEQQDIGTQSEVPEHTEDPGTAHELAREHKKLRKTRASKESVKELRADVDKLNADSLPLDLLFGDPAPAAVLAAEPQQEQTQRLPRKKRKLPSANEAIIQLADPPEASSS